MSPVSRGRRHGRGRPAKKARHPVGDPSAALARALLDACAAHSEDDSPLTAECMVAQALGMAWLSDEYGRLEAADALARAVAAHPVVARHPGGAVLLRVLAELAPGEDVRALAQRRYEELSAQAGAAWLAPSWLPRVNAVRLVRGDVLDDVYGDQRNHLWTLRYTGLRAAGGHTVVTLTDRNLHVVKDLFLRETEEIAPQMRLMSDPGTTWPDFDRATSLAEVAVHVDWCDHTLGRPFGDETASTWFVLKARMRALKANPRRYAEPAEMPERRRRALLEEFLASEWGRGVVSDDVPPRPASHDAVAFAASTMISYACDFGAGDPLRWSPIAAELYLTDWAPRKVAWDAEDIPWVTPTLESFVQWAGEQTGLERRWIEETVGAVHEFGGDFVVARLDGSQRSPATVMMESMLADGVDPTDQAAVQRWIDRYNASLD